MESVEIIKYKQPKPSKMLPLNSFFAVLAKIIIMIWQNKREITLLMLQKGSIVLHQIMVIVYRDVKNIVCYIYSDLHEALEIVIKLYWSEIELEIDTSGWQDDS